MSELGLVCRAVVLDSERPGSLGLESFPVPRKIPDDGMLLRTEIAGICGSDIHLLQSPPGLGRIIPGHEIIGKVHLLGERFREASGQDLSEGDRVGLESTIPCHYCPYCLGAGSRGDKHIDYGLCEDSKVWGAIPLQDPPWLAGGWSEYVQVPREALAYRLPPDLPAREAVLLEPLAVAVKAVRRASVGCEDLVVVQGPGPIGLLSLVAAREMGAHWLILVGVGGDEARLGVGEALGATGLINAVDGDPVEQLKSMTGGKKATRVIDTTGSVAAVAQGLAMTARGGVYVSVGGQNRNVEVSIHPDYLLRNKIDMLFSHLGSGCYQISREIIVSGRYQLDKLVTHTFRIEQVHDAVSVMAERRSGCVKSALVF